MEGVPMGKLATELRAKFATPADALRKLGFSEAGIVDLLGEDGTMQKPALDWTPVQRRQANDQSTAASSGWPSAGGRAPVAGASRDRRRSRDQLPDDPDEVRDKRGVRDDRDLEDLGQPLHYLTELSPQDWEEFREAEPQSHDRAVKWAKDRKLRRAKDEEYPGGPDPFPGRPNPGGTHEPIDQRCGNSEAYDDARLLEAARMGGRAGDVDTINARRSGASRSRYAEDRSSAAQSFAEMFPSTKRIGRGGFV
jgi:hypothetical protein